MVSKFAFNSKDLSLNHVEILLKIYCLKLLENNEKEAEYGPLLEKSPKSMMDFANSVRLKFSKNLGFATVM